MDLECLDQAKDLKIEPNQFSFVLIGSCSWVPTTTIINGVFTSTQMRGNDRSNRNGFFFTKHYA